MKVLLHVCYRDLDLLTENNTILWSDLYNQHCEEFENDHYDLLDPPIDNLEADFINEENEQEYEELKDKE